jgi:nucleoside triphosphate pyrophosphatase
VALIVLASASPRRAEILTAAGIPFTIRPAWGVDETPLPGEPPREYTMRLAKAKALPLTRRPDEVVLGADTTVVLEGEILGKPADADDAARMLRALSGRVHEVITGICLSKGLDLVVDAASTQVWFHTLSEEEISDYAVSGEPMDKAGAYGIQGLASKFVSRIEGCYYNVMGLPVSLVYRHLVDRSWYK